MALPPKDHESSLVGYWPLDDGTPTDRALAKRHGAITGAAAWPSATFLWPAYLKAIPRDEAPRPAFTSIGRGFGGELADVQIWELARAPAEIADTRYLQLTGAEHGLAASYRLGAIVHEEPPTRPGLLGALPRRDRVRRSIRRRTAARPRDGLWQEGRGVRERRGHRGRPARDLRGELRVPRRPRPILRSLRPTRTAPAARCSRSRTGARPARPRRSGSRCRRGYQQADFAPLADGWYRASCRVTVPDGVPLLRAFEIANVRGTWGAEPTLPQAEWTAIYIRKHLARMISDVVTREGLYRSPGARRPARAVAVGAAMSSRTCARPRPPCRPSRRRSSTSRPASM